MIEFIKMNNHKLKYHTTLANYFQSKSHYLDEPANEEPNIRKLIELPWQQTKGEMWEEITKTLFDFLFLQAKVTAQFLNILMDDFGLALDTIPYELYRKQKGELRLLQSALRLSGHVLYLDIHQLAGQLIGRLSSRTDPDIQALLISAQHAQKQTWLHPLRCSLNSPDGALLRIFALHGNRENSLFMGIQSLTLTPDDKYVISASMDNTISIWDIESGEEVRQLTGHTRGVKAVTLTPDGTKIISGSEDKTLKIWDLKTGDLLQSLNGHTGAVNSLAMTPDGKLVLSGSKDNTIRVWNIDSGESVMELFERNGEVNSIAVTPDGKHVISATEGIDDICQLAQGEISIWSLASGTLVRTLIGHTAPIVSVVITTDGRFVISVANDISIRFWDLESGEQLRKIDGHANTIILTPDGNSLILGSERVADGTNWQPNENAQIKVYDLLDIRKFYFLTEDTSPVSAMACTSDGNYVITGASDGSIKLWNISKKERFPVRLDHKGATLSIVVTADGKLAISASDDRTLKVWDLKNNGVLLHTLEGHDHWVRAVGVTSDGKRLISGSNDNKVLIWDLESAKLMHVVSINNPYQIVVAESHKYRYGFVAGFGQLKVLDLDSGSQLPLLQKIFSVTSMTVTSDGRLFISNQLNDEQIRVWNIQSGILEATFFAKKYSVNVLLVAPDNKHLIAGLNDGTLKVWHLNIHKQPLSLKGHAKMVTTVAVSPDSQYVISGGAYDPRIDVWSLRTGEWVYTLEGHSDNINDLAIMLNGDRLVSVSDDHLLKVWDLRTGNEIATFTSDEELTCCALGRDNSVIVASGETGRVHILRLEEIENKINNIY